MFSRVQKLPRVRGGSYTGKYFFYKKHCVCVSVCFLSMNRRHCLERTIILCLKRLFSMAFEGIQGFMSHIDENGDAEGNYTVLARTSYVSQYSNYSMRPVGYFVKVSNASSIDELPVSKTSSKRRRSPKCVIRM